MADLDDFFAKKDRKKYKGKKLLTADEISIRLEESGKRNEKTKKEKPVSSNTGQDGEEPGTPQEEDEWKDFEEEKKDYTGLKIQNMILTEVESDDFIEGGQGDEEDGLEETEAEELVSRRKLSTGPWKCVPQAQIGPSGDEIAQPVVERPLLENQRPSTRCSSSTTNSSGSSIYIPPFARNQLVKPTAHACPRITKTRAALDVHSEDAFPALSASKSVDVPSAWSKRKRDENVGFEEVRNSKSHSSRNVDSDNRMTSGNLTLGNKFGALNNDQS